MLRILVIISGVFLSFSQVLAESAKPMTSEPVGIGNLFQVFFGLIVIIALIVGMAWFMRRMNNVSGGMANGMRVLGSVSVGQRERMVLVQIGDEQLVVGIAPGHIRTLHVLEKPLEVNSSTKSHGSVSFADRLNAALKSKLRQ